MCVCTVIYPHTPTDCGCMWIYVGVYVCKGGGVVLGDRRVYLLVCWWVYVCVWGGIVMVVVCGRMCVGVCGRMGGCVCIVKMKKLIFSVFSVFLNLKIKN